MVRINRYTYVAIETSNLNETKEIILNTFHKLFGEVSYRFKPFKFYVYRGNQKEVLVIKCLRSFLDTLIFTLSYILLKHGPILKVLGLETTYKRLTKRVLIFI